ncbi:5,6-dimethylbenzimidazole synthase [Novosphingobium sp. JCM 18896]|uniref:5,6-dimethylbenzimidazole synthase n=1 Tax=Novosphingobium sp. JCM 18896 TaxID=2989731 RepID=UPI00222337AF|nr:5,6-dimethylbenzimidazole synthase [Novosphingobium sp. JCM 18896]MCW1429030.1 5,6-dimethylbenzimidazole synthase [Novosphingobium sp. JCM 18896]
MQFTPSDREVLHRLLAWRRDVREFQPRPVAEDLIARLHAAMELSPSVGNSRPWRVIRVEDGGLRAQVRAQFAVTNAEAAAVYDERRAEYERLVLAGLDTAPLQLAVFTALDPDAGDGLGRQSMPETLEQSTAMAVYTLWLAARAENVGLGMVSILDPDAMTRLFAAPADWRFSAYLCLGYPLRADDDTPLLHRVDWQENTASAWQTR